MVQLQFNATGVKPNQALEAVPSGNYPVIITASQKKPTAAGTGAYYEFEMTIQGGEFAGRKLFDRLNVENPNQTAVDIAYATLSAMCHVTGRLNITDTQQLHGVPFIAVAVKKPRNDQPDVMTNEVRGYKDINGNDPGKTPGNQNNAGGGNGGGGPAWGNGNGPTNMNGNGGGNGGGQPQGGGNGYQQQPQGGQPQGGNGGNGNNWQGNGGGGQPDGNNWQGNGQGGGNPQGGGNGQGGNGNGQAQINPNDPPPWANN